MESVRKEDGRPAWARALNTPCRWESGVWGSTRDVGHSGHRLGQRPGGQERGRAVEGELPGGQSLHRSPRLGGGFRFNR